MVQLLGAYFLSFHSALWKSSQHDLVFNFWLSRDHYVITIWCLFWQCTVSGSTAINAFTSRFVNLKTCTLQCSYLIAVTRNGRWAALCSRLLPKRHEHKATSVPQWPGQAAEGNEKLTARLELIFPAVRRKSSRHLFITKPTKCECGLPWLLMASFSVLWMDSSMSDWLSNTVDLHCKSFNKNTSKALCWQKNTPYIMFSLCMWGCLSLHREWQQCDISSAVGRKCFTSINNQFKISSCCEQRVCIRSLRLNQKFS